MLKKFCLFTWMMLVGQMTAGVSAQSTYNICPLEYHVNEAPAEQKPVYIGATGYNSLDDAVAAVPAATSVNQKPREVTVTLMESQTITKRINIKSQNIRIVAADGADITINRGNGYQGICFLTAASDKVNGKSLPAATLTIEGLTLDGQNVDVANASFIESGNNGTVVLKNVAIKNCKNSGWSILENKSGGRLTLNGVTFDNCEAARAVVFVGTNNVTLQGRNAIPAIYLEKQLTLTEQDMSVTDPIVLVTEMDRPYGMLVKNGKALSYTSNQLRMSQQGSHVYGMMLPVAAQYNHPALLHNSTDITAAKARLLQEPYKSALQHLQAVSKANASGAVEWLKRLDYNNWGPEGSHGQNTDYSNFTKAVADARLAYQLALCYQMKDDNAAADKAVAILNDWARNCKGIYRLDDYDDGILDPNEYLINIQAYQFANAAELLRNYSGWQDDDFVKFQNWMRQTFADVAYLYLSKRMDQHYWLNWDLIAQTAMLSIGVLCDDKALVNYAVNYATTGQGSGNVNNAVVATHQDTDSDETLAQSQESGRDQGHATLDVTMLGVLCQTAQNIGIDLFTPYKALEMAEYIGKYNLKTSSGTFVYDNVPFTEYNNGEVHHTVISANSRGTERNSWELFHAYARKNGKADKYTEAWVKYLRAKRAYGEGVATSNDELGFGTLMFGAEIGEDTPTAINDELIGDDGLVTTPVVYNLAGYRVTSPHLHNGIYIVGSGPGKQGKKVVVK